MLLAPLLALAAALSGHVVPATLPTTASPLPVHVGGRAIEAHEGKARSYRRQWPGSYFETAFTGERIFFALGGGEVRVQVLLDGQVVGTLVKPKPGAYLVKASGPGDHQARIQIVSESQQASSTFRGFFAAEGTRGRAWQRRSRAIEFVGDSHTVGYGNSSATETCSPDEVWSTTDSSQGIAGLLGRRYDADYQINAISGRGVVRNYGGFAADPLPVAYPFTLLDHSRRYSPSDWRPQVIVVALGTNDFTTPLHPGERWLDRDALHADFEKTYVEFLSGLRAHNPRALILLWATDMAGGEIESEVAKVAQTLHDRGDRRLVYLPIDGLSFSACNHHPSLADDRVIADRLASVID